MILQTRRQPEEGCQTQKSFIPLVSFRWRALVSSGLLPAANTCESTRPVPFKLSQLAFHKMSYQKAWLPLGTKTLSPCEGQLGVHSHSMKALAVTMKTRWCGLPLKINQPSPTSFCS